ncbi:biopolymer transport protein ExbD [Desulfuromusa kysingii]|uniref:Biopolymer transport protein ExbD n=1 Tax=Desulfuromusa kysingii TaxID=37625 RepID=A0A1H4BF53_9BACT|nr:biopolymer transporter ExbD [Desulfuromusa kysingii]SEA46726.1 biopolymer transport protein ExbD [Desulfuromusa kysingii]
MGFRKKSLEAPKVDLTPMIDVVFLLLIFFMISTTFIERPGLNINLPESSSEQIKHSQKEVQIYLAENGDIYLHQEKISFAAFVAHLESIAPEEVQYMTFILMADKAAKHGTVVQLMDAAKHAGFKNLAIATDRDVTND